ncbi:MAG TPA: hypothetical protein VMZ53_07805 [Kofleriaceae bacterium]|nr:hypothetical protein [Kofleriaceae bacterium]
MRRGCLRVAAIVSTVAACGRVAFETRIDAEAPTPDALVVDAPTGVTFVRNIAAQMFTANGSAASIPLQASAAGNAILVHATCTSVTTPMVATLEMTGTWTFTQLGPVERYLSQQGVVLGAIAPNTNPTSLLVGFSIPDCAPLSIVADELTGNDPTGGTTTFDANAQGIGSGGCSVPLVTGSDDETLWGACISEFPITGVGTEFSKAGDDGNDHWSEYRVGTGPAGTSVATSFMNGVGGYLAAGVAIKPR